MLTNARLSHYAELCDAMHQSGAAGRTIETTISTLRDGYISTSEEEQSNADGVDAMGISSDQSARRAHYGPTSAATMVDHLLNTMGKVEARAPWTHDSIEDILPYQTTIPSIQTTSQQPHRPHGFTSLPRAMELLDAFERDTWPIYPAVSMVAVRTSLEKLHALSATQTGLGTSHHAELALLHAILALSAAFMGDESEGAAYYQVARAVMDKDGVDQAVDTLWQGNAHSL